MACMDPSCHYRVAHCGPLGTGAFSITVLNLYNQKQIMRKGLEQMRVFQIKVHRTEVDGCSRTDRTSDTTD